MDKTLKDQLNEAKYDLTTYQIEEILKAFSEAVSHAKPKWDRGSLEIKECVDAFEENLRWEIGEGKQ